MSCGSQEKVATEKLVPQYNKAMRDHKTWHTMKADSGSKTGYYDASFDGPKAKRIVLEAVGQDGDNVGWIKAIGFKDHGWVRRTVALWDTWKQVMVIGRKLRPSSEEQMQFGPLCKKLFRCGHSPNGIYGVNRLLAPRAPRRAPSALRAPRRALSDLCSHAMSQLLHVQASAAQCHG
jgi:hypothetical protein